MIENPIDELPRVGFGRNEIIFRQGQPGDAAYVVERGKVRIERKMEGKWVVLAELGPGAVFGEMALADDSPRMATAISVDTTSCRMITRQRFEQVLDQSPRFIAALARIFTHNLRELADRPMADMPNLLEI